MNNVDGLRVAVTGLIGLAATAEQALLAETELGTRPGALARGP